MAPTGVYDGPPSTNWLAFLSASGIHPKLSVSAPGDADEREADAVAERVMRMAPPPTASISVGSGGAGLARACAAYSQDDEDARITRKARAPGVAPGAAQSAVEAVSGGGHPLDPGTRAWFEPRFGHDLSEVRIHTGTAAQNAATGIGARAYTHGAEIAFAQGQYSPGTEAGRRLLAHELTHALQQGGGAVLLTGDADAQGTATGAPSPGGEVIHRDAREDVVGLSISSQFAVELGDNELTGLIAYLESLASGQTSSDPLDEVIENNLGVLRAEWLERQVSVPVHSEAQPVAPSPPVAKAVPQPLQPFTVGDRDEHIPVAGYRGQLRPLEQYKQPRAIDFAKRGCFEAAELAENYMCPTCHVLTKVDPCDFNLRGYVDSYHESYKIGQFMIGSAALGLAAPGLMATVGAFEAGVATTEAVTGESSGIRPTNLMMGEFDPGRKLSTTERIFSGAEAALFWTGIGLETSAARRSASPALRESRNAYQITGRSRPSQQYDDPFTGQSHDIAARSGTPRSQRTAIDADIAEVADYNLLKENGEVGLAGPNGANRAGPDSITFNKDDGFIYVNDSQTYWTPTPTANKATDLPSKWRVEARQAARQADLGDPVLEQQIREAAAAGKISRRNHQPRKVEPPADESGPYIDIGED